MGPPYRVRRREDAEPMDVAFFSTKTYERAPFEAANKARGHRLEFLEPRVTSETAPLAEGFACVCGFVNDRFDSSALEVLHAGGVRFLALRSAGFNHVDLRAAREFGIRVAHVPEYSPHAVAEYTVALILALNPKVHRSYARVREGNFSLDGLMGFDLHGRTVGIVGTGRIGTAFAGIMAGMGCRLVAYDPVPNEECRSLGVSYVELTQLLEASDVVSLHCPLTPETHHLIDADALRRMRDG
jgi:D-lactate dehydrogenase